MTTFSMTEVCHAVMREGITCYIEHTGGGVMVIYAGKKVGDLWTVAAGPGRQVDRVTVGSTRDFCVGVGGTSFSRTEDLWECPDLAGSTYYIATCVAAEIIRQVRERDVQTPVVTPEVKTWPETPEEQIAFTAWQYEVVGGGTPYGFRDWLAHGFREDSLAAEEREQ